MGFTAVHIYSRVIIDALVSSFADITWTKDSLSILNHDAITICLSVV